jgi:hypothetical protein
MPDAAPPWRSTSAGFSDAMRKSDTIPAQAGVLFFTDRTVQPNMVVEVRKCWFLRHQRDELGINPATVLQALQLAPIEHAPLPVKGIQLDERLL